MQNVKYDDWNQKRELLEKIDLFQDFSRFDIPKVADIYHHILMFEKNERIIRQGASDKCFYILLTGSVRVTKGEDPLALIDLHSGEFFGEVSFLSNNKRTRHVFANEKAFVLRLTKKMLDNLDGSMREKIKDKLIEKLVERIVNPSLDEDMESTHQ